jgi:archaellum component FlaC
MAEIERRAQELGTNLSKLSKDVTMLSEELGQDIDSLINRVNIDVTIKTKIVEDNIKDVKARLDKLKSQVNVAPLLTSYHRAA